MHKWATSWLTILKFNSSYTEVQEWARKWRQAFEMDRKGELQEATGKCGVSFQNWQAKTRCDSLHISTKKVGHVHPFKGVCVWSGRRGVCSYAPHIYTLRSSGTDILYGCHLLLDVCIIYFISSDCIMNSSLSYTIY